MAAPSANTSGRPSPTKAEHVAEDLNGKIDKYDEVIMKKEKDVNEIEVGEDVSRNGEFIPTKFAWISLGFQKENAKRLQNITKKDDKHSK